MEPVSATLGRDRRWSGRARPLRAFGCLAMAALSAGLLVGVTAQPASGGTTVGLLDPDPVTPVALAAPGIVVTPGQDVPDPYVVKVAGVYYMFASQSLFFGPNIPVMSSSSLTTWPLAPIDAMPRLPSWADAGFTWSPDVRELDGRYVLWFNANVKGNGFDGMKCLGAATSTKVMGPYVSTETAPEVCQRDHLGSIDPRTFVGPDGRLWLLWKSDDNSDLNASTHSSIYIQQLSADGLRVLGSPVALMSADLPWEGRIVESPDMVYAAGHYWLFFSGNWFNQPAYGVGVAECDTVTGPCTPAIAGPWLSSNAQGAGPGEESLFDDGSRWWMLYAPFAVAFQAFTPRPAVLARVSFGPDGPVVVAPGTRAWSAAPDPPKRPAVSLCPSHPFEAECGAWRERLGLR